MLERIQEIFVRVTGITDYVITPKTKLDRRNVNISSFTLIQLFCVLHRCPPFHTDNPQARDFIASFFIFIVIYFI